MKQQTVEEKRRCADNYGTQPYDRIRKRVEKRKRRKKKAKPCQKE